MIRRALTRMSHRLSATTGGLAAILVLTVPALASTTPSSHWEQLSTTAIGAQQFIAAHPKWDGRGVLIAVCDSGVALGLPGLQKTSDGKVKILDARDFTTEGRIDLENAVRSMDEHGKALHGKEGRWLYGVDHLDPALPADGEVLVGYIDEKRFVNGGVKDLNDNGRMDDTFGLVVYKPEGAEEWLAVLDTNGDGDLTGEPVLHDYAVAQESFHLGGNDPHAAADLVTYALNLWPGEKRAALFFDDNGHGSHVCGIAAGHDLDGQPGYDGIAPGAQILALKIGNGSLSGGATEPGSMLEAWRFAVRKARELDMPLVIQMSYGVGSENEGDAVAERLIDQLLADNPDVVATVSAGNEGPGLSTVGLPAAAEEVLAVAAVEARSTARIVYGVDLPADRIFYFSSRGGELAKPDLACPGFAASSVPLWTGSHDVYRGTSMAAPQAAGACALLLSAARDQGLPLRRDLVRAALKGTAHPIAHFGPLDFGPGLADVPAAWKAYTVLAARDPHRPLRWKISTESPEMVSGTGPAVFWRGSFFPTGQKRQTVRIEPVFPRETPRSFIKRFYQAFDLQCTAPWLKLGKPSTYVKQDGAATIPIGFDTSRLSKPGLYQTEILAWDRSLGRDQRKVVGPALRIPVAVAVPVAFSADGTLEHSTGPLGPGVTGRTFFHLSACTAAAQVHVELARESRELSALVTLFDPEGRRRVLGRLSPARYELEASIPPRDMAAGVWELDVSARDSNTGPITAALNVETMPLVRPVSRTVELEHPAGSAPRGSIRVTSGLNRTWTGSGSGSVVGTVLHREEDVHGATWTTSLAFAPEESAMDLYLEMPASDWNLFTDVAVQVLDDTGKAILSDGFGYRKLHLHLDRPGQGNPKLTLKIIAATADPSNDSPSWHLSVDQIRRFTEAVPVTVKPSAGQRLILYPDHDAVLELELGATPPAPPSKANWLLEIQLTPEEGDLPTLDLELQARRG